MTHRTASDPWLEALALPIRGAVDRVAAAVRGADERVSGAVARQGRAAASLYEAHGDRIPSPAVRAAKLALPPRLSHPGWSPDRDELLADVVTEPILDAVAQARDAARAADERLSEAVSRKRAEALDRCGPTAQRVPSVVKLALPPRLSHPGWSPGGDELLADVVTEPILDALSQARQAARAADERLSEAISRKRAEALDRYGAHVERIPPAALRVVSLMLPPRILRDGVLRLSPAGTTPHTLLIAAPRGFCAGVVRAVDALELVVEREPAPIYAFHEIVHNRHIVESFEARGVIFIDDLAEVPDGARVVFSAHGVSPAVVEEAERRSLRVIDATCPLVTRVHLETKRAASQGYDVLLVGHRGHDETVGTLGEAPERTRVVEDAGEVAALGAIDAPVFVVTQTTLSMDDTSGVIDEIRARHPSAEIRNDICYATTNRQHAARTIARRADLVLVVGSRNSSNSLRLREVAEDEGARAHLVDSLADIDPAWYEGVGVVGLTSGASVPDELLAPIIDDLRARGVATVEPVVLTEEDVEFRLPEGVGT